MDLNKNPNKWIYDIEDVEEGLSDYWRDIFDEIPEDNSGIAEDGRWITIGARKEGEEDEDDEGRKGRHIYLENGESPREAINELKDKKKDDGVKQETQKEKAPEEKPEQKVDEKKEDLSGLSEAELNKRKEELKQKRLDIMSAQGAFIESDEEIKKLREDAINVLHESYYLDGEKRDEVLKKYDEIKAKEKQREGWLIFKYQKEHQNWHDISDKEREIEQEFKRRKEQIESDFVNKIDESAKKVADGDIDGAINDLIRLDKETNSVEGYDTKLSLKRGILNKIAKPIVETKAKTIGDELKKYDSKTDKLVESLSDYDKEFTQAQEDERSFGKRADELWRKYKNEPEGVERTKVYDELQKARNDYYNAMDKTLEKKRNLVYDLADKIRTVYGDTGNNLGRLKGKNSPFCKEMNERLQKLFDGVLGSGVDVSEAPKIKKTTAYRSCHRDNEGLEISRHSTKGCDALIHEYGHYLEEKNKKMLLNSEAFLTYRTKDDELKPMNSFKRGYRRNEITRADKFFDPYCGKFYASLYAENNSYYNARSSEIMSMGLERLFTNPVKFAQEDREYFNFVIANMRGEL